MCLFLAPAKDPARVKMNLYAYLTALNRLWNNDDGGGVSRFLSIYGNHSSNPNLHIENPDSAVERQIGAPLDEVVATHLRVLFYLHDNRKLWPHYVIHQLICFSF